MKKAIGYDNDSKITSVIPNSQGRKAVENNGNEVIYCEDDSLEKIP